MSVVLDDGDRRVIPRWRDFKSTAAVGELDSNPIGAPKAPEGGLFLVEKLEAWQANQSLETAGDLVAAGLVLGKQAEAEDAAGFILQQAHRAAPGAQRVAKRLLSLGFSGYYGDADELTEGVSASETIHRLREYLEEHPRNSLLRVDLSRAYASLGLRAQAVRAMEIALSLAPFNRFVLRSAARLFTHIDEPDHAHDLLRRTDAGHDPWLLSAEIATASVVGRTSRHIRAGREIVDSDRYAPLQTSELASALGTVEFMEGSVRRARQLFRRSLTDPTENSVAQAEWAGRRMPDLVDLALPMKRRSYEALAWRTFQRQDWENCLLQCQNWLLDEPFSSRPAVLGSSVAMLGPQDFTTGERFAQLGLNANPNHPILLNNLAVALASRGRVKDGREALGRVNRAHLDKRMNCVLLATEGLLCFRSGDPQQGRALYGTAIDGFDDPALARPRALAALHLAREEALLNSSQADVAFHKAMDYCEGEYWPEVLSMRDIVDAVRSRNRRAQSPPDAPA